MIISELPYIQNVDQIHIYHKNKLIKKINIDNLDTVSNQIEKQLVPYYFYRDIDYMTVCLDGALTTIIVLEIMLK